MLAAGSEGHFAGWRIGKSQILDARTNLNGCSNVARFHGILEHPETCFKHVATLSRGGNPEGDFIDAINTTMQVVARLNCANASGCASENQISRHEQVEF